MTYLVDTNVCISFLRERNPKLIARWRLAGAGEVALCSVVVYELVYGAARSSAPNREYAKLNAFLPHLKSLPFDDDCAHECARIRHDLEQRGAVIGPYDLQIAATARHHDLVLVTHNTREFGRVAGLRIIDWEV